MQFAHNMNVTNIPLFLDINIEYVKKNHSKAGESLRYFLLLLLQTEFYQSNHVENSNRIEYHGRGSYDV